MNTNFWLLAGIMTILGLMLHFGAGCSVVVSLIPLLLLLLLALVVRVFT